MRRSQKIVEHGQCRFHTELVGDGPPLLLIQGVGIHAEGWGPQVQALASEYSCLTFDNRGMGRSQPLAGTLSIVQMAEDCQAILAAYGWESAHLIGHSMGGLIALALALLQPEKTLSLSLLCTMANGKKTAPLTWRMISLGMGTQLGTKAMRRRAFVRLILPPGNWTNPQLDQLAEKLTPYFGHDLAIQPSVARQQLQALRGYDATLRLGELGAIPTLVVSATHDPIAPPQLGQAIAKGIPNARFVELDNASHGVPLAQPERVNSLIMEHLGGVLS